MQQRRPNAAKKIKNKFKKIFLIRKNKEQAGTQLELPVSWITVMVAMPPVSSLCISTHEVPWEKAKLSPPR